MASSVTNHRNDFQPFPLTPLDHTMPRIYVSLFLCFRSSRSSACLEQIEAGVNRLVSCLPFLAGEIRPWVASHGKSGVMGVQGPCASVQTIPIFSRKSFPGRVLPTHQCYKHGSPEDSRTARLDAPYYPLPAIIPPSETQPLLRFQANILDDGILLALSLSHFVFDGPGTGKLIEMFAACCRASSLETVSLPTNSKLEAQLRYRLSNLSQPHDSLTDHAAEYGSMHPAAAVTVIPAPDITVSSVTPLIQTNAFVFSDDRIRYIRDACNRILDRLIQGNGNGIGTGRDNLAKEGGIGSPSYLSCNDTLTAMLGLCIDTARAKDAGRSAEYVRLALAANFRQRMRPPFPGHYLGNAVKVIQVSYGLPPDGGSESTPSDFSPWIQQKQLFCIAQIALQLRLGLDSTDDDNIRSITSYLRRQDDWQSIDIRHSGTAFSSWRDMPVYGLDFGPVLGRIDNFERQQGLWDGTCVVMPANPSGDARAQWDVRLTLPPGVMQLLAQSAMIRWASNPRPPFLSSL